MGRRRSQINAGDAMTARGLPALTALIAASTALAASACVENPPLVANPLDQPLVVADIRPDPEAGPVARDQAFVLTFNAYLNPENIVYYTAASVTSGGLRVVERSAYRMVDKQLIVTMRTPMEPGLFYTLSPNADALRSVTGQTYAGPLDFEVFVGDFERSADPALDDLGPPPTWEDIAPILARCHACHDDPEWKLTSISPEDMIGRPSSQNPALNLVEPYDAPGSYLMHKILWDYPTRVGQPQPPPWAGYDELPIESQRLIERWIRTGAR